MRTSSQKPGASAIAYKLQPQGLKWPCALCGKKEVQRWRKGEGRPRYAFLTFASKAERDGHIAREHP